jgi:hypothetical protein
MINPGPWIYHQDGLDHLHEATAFQMLYRTRTMESINEVRSEDSDPPSNTPPYPYREEYPSRISTSLSLALDPGTPQQMSESRNALLDADDVYIATYIHYTWEREDTLAVFCTGCRRERCGVCERRTFSSVTASRNCLTHERGEFKVCTPCWHGFCPGDQVRLVCTCRDCGRESCGRCLRGGSAEGGDGGAGWCRCAQLADGARGLSS